MVEDENSEKVKKVAEEIQQIANKILNV